MSDEAEGRSTEAIRAERMEHWAALEAEVGELADRLGFGIDEGIQETLVALHAHSLETSQSCEGHDDHGEALPWVAVAAPEPDGWETDAELKQRWQSENERLAGRLAELVEAWYATRAEQGERVNPEARLELHPQGIFGAVRLEPAAQARLTALPEAERAHRAPSLRQEMERFSRYLRERFLSGF